MTLLSGLRIVSVEQFGSAPYGSMFLADLGAEVVKIENAALSGDPARHIGPFRLGSADSEYFQAWNSNKRSVTLNLKMAEDRDTLIRLAASADALINNLRGDLPAKMGLDYASLSKMNPRIVCLHISAYGRDNSRASWPGYDYLMQAEAGLMDLTGEPDGPPCRVGAPAMIDHVTGLTGMVGLLAGVINARRTGQGCDVDTCLFDAALHQLGYVAVWNLNEGYRATRQRRSAHFSVAPVQTFATTDGWIYLMCMTDKFWTTLIAGTGNAALAADSRFMTMESRFTHRNELGKELDSIFITRPTQHWLDIFEGRVPIAPILSVEQALSNPFLSENEMINSISHPERAELKLLSNPLKVNSKRLAQRACSPLGEDNAEICAGARLHTQ